MRLDIFQSDKGDCVLLTGADGRRILCDGGMYGSMREHVAPELSKLRDPARDVDIDYVYVSHIDQDHISGVLQLLRDELEWRVYEFHLGGEAEREEPEVPRPPRIGGIWHNAFRDQVSKNKGAITNLLAAAVPALAASRVPSLERASAELGEVALSVAEAIELSKLIDPALLGIPLNELPGQGGPARLLMVRNDAPNSFDVGGMRLTIVGPTDDELRALRTGWDNWLRANKSRVEELRREMRRRVEEFSASGDPSLLDLSDWNGVPNFRGVTAPNVASLMFLVEEGDRRLLLTGDSQQDIILKGLRESGVLAAGAFLHVDVLKVQHHGSENNLDARFARTVSADHYVFCGNGEHGNPDLGVLRFIVASRISDDAAVRAGAEEAQDDDRPFTFWFSTSSATNTANEEALEHWAELEEEVERLRQQAGDRMRVNYNDGVALTLRL